MTIPKLDYSKPPPGYKVSEEPDTDSVDWGLEAEGSWKARLQWPGARGRARPHVEWESTWLAGADDALAAAWAHYKAHNDPPGLTTWRVRDADDMQMVEPPLWGWTIDGHDDCCEENTEEQQEAVEARFVKTQTEARAAAWAWHDRRHALADRLASAIFVAAEVFRGRPIRTVIPRNEAQHFPECEMMSFHAWPRCLTWSDEQVAEVERWLVDSTAKMPAVLRDEATT
jgi:hypothetical protein